MLRIIGTLVAAAMTLAAGAVLADSLTERREPKAGPKEQEVEVACGRSEQSNCTTVVPIVNAMTIGARLTPLESRGGPESLEGLCDGQVNMAVVELNALAAYKTRADCLDHLVVLEPPLYPHEGFLVVRADTPESDFGAMIDKLKSVDVLRVATRGVGSSDDRALRDMLDADPDWKRRVDVQPDDIFTAAQKLRLKQLDAFFVMEAPHNAELLELRAGLSPSARQEVKLISLRPSPRFFEKRFQGRRVYADTTLEDGWFDATRSISTPTVLVVSRKFYEKQPDTMMRVLTGLRRAVISIMARLGTSPDWRKAFEDGGFRRRAGETRATSAP